MKKNFELIFIALKVPIDFLIIILAGISSYKLRFQEFVTDIRPAVYGISFNEYLSILVLIASIGVVIFVLFGVYNIKKKVNLAEEIIKIVNTSSVVFMFLVSYIFFKRDYFSSRFIILAGFAFAVIYLISSRLVLRKIKAFFYKNGFGVNNVILVGIGSNFNAILNYIENNPSSGYRIIDTVASFEEFEKFYSEKYKNSVSQVIQTNSGRLDDNLKFLDFCEHNHIVFKYVADLFDAKAVNMEINTLNGVPLVEIKKTKLDGWGRIIKRIFDISASSFFIVLFSPILIITAIAIKLESKGPVIYKNKRVGKNTEEFDTFKFRSMYYEMSTGVGNADQDKKALELEKQLIEKNNTRTGALYKIKDDPRVTKVGNFIRKYSIDELPQFFNVFIGDMSLVGPRPHQPREVANYKKEQVRLLDIRPGITGMAQVSGRSDLSFDDEFKLDAFYMDNWSFLMDLKIVFKTPFAVFSRRKVE